MDTEKAVGANETGTQAATGRVGVFLCQCGQKIASRVDLPELEKLLADDPAIGYVQTLPFPCMKPGLDAISQVLTAEGLDRVVIAGCEGRLFRKRFETALADFGVGEGQVDMVNLRDHVARVHEGEPAELAVKGAKLIRAAVAGLAVMVPKPKEKVEIDGPVMILGGGIGTFAAAQELIRQGVETIIAVSTEDPEDEIRMLHERYPGERQSHDKVRKIMDEVYASPLIRQISVGELDKVMGRVGQYTVVFSSEGDRPPMVFEVGSIIAALDGVMLNQGSAFGHDGQKVLCQTEMEEYIWLHGPPRHRVVFWINDFEAEQPYAYLAARTAWNMATYIREKSVQSDVKILYNDRMNPPLTASERRQARQLGIEWIPYDGAFRPTVQNGYITIARPEDNIEVEIEWDQLVLSPRRAPGLDATQTAKVLGMHVSEGEFLKRNPQMVRPEMVGQDEKFFCGSALTPCDLRETLRQGRRAASKTAELYLEAREGDLYAPRAVCVVDQEKCIGCGLCHEICDCGGIMPVESPGGNIPRTVDPMVCTGGGTCAAACPHHALSIQTNTSLMHEARVAALAKSLGPGEILGWGCQWGGGAAADHAGLHGLQYDARFHLLPIGCIGQLDAEAMGRALLEGAAGVLLIGCPPEECHHSYGVDHAWSRVNLVKKLLSLSGLERQRIALAHCDLNKPEQFVKTVEGFLADIDALGPIPDDEATQEKVAGLYATLQNPRVRWALGASLRRPWEVIYPGDQRNARAYDGTLMDIVTEEYLRARINNLLTREDKSFSLEDICQALDQGDKQPVLNVLRDMVGEGQVSRIYKDRTPFYLIQ
jgi:heterodisulfide reductase subunit A-like polyferredoxin/coenzyme F420-reducing hydrogenase delta subunit